MHIVYVCREYPPSLRGGGIASYIKEMAQGMCRAGHRVTVVCASDDTRKEDTYKDGDVNVIRLSGGDFVIPQVEKANLLRKLRPFYRFYSYRKRIMQTIRSLKDVDIIEVPEYGAESYYLHSLGIPVVVRLHTPMLLNHDDFSLHKLAVGNMRYYWQGRQELNEIKKASYITSCSTSLKEWTVRYVGVRPDKIRVVYNPIQTEREDRFVSTPHENGKKQILFAGTVCDWKGCGDLAEACRLLAENTDVDFQLSLVGKTGAYADELQRRYGRYGWFNIVGKIPREELMRRYAVADVVCFPSWWENMPMVCIEAMLCGGIVIGSNSGGMSEIITDGKDGFLVNPHEPQALAGKLHQVLVLGEEEKRSLSRNARQKIKDKFSMDVIVKQMTAYYQYVIKQADERL